MKQNHLSHRRLLKSLIAAALGGALLSVPSESQAAPNGTRPTVLSGVAVTSVYATTMKAAGRLTNLGGKGLAGQRVEVYGAGSEWRSIKRKSWGGFSRLALVVARGGDDHEMARAGEVLIGFGTAFAHARFAASGAQGQEVGGAEKEHFLQGLRAGERRRP